MPTHKIRGEPAPENPPPDPPASPPPPATRPVNGNGKSERESPVPQRGALSPDKYVPIQEAVPYGYAIPSGSPPFPAIINGSVYMVTGVLERTVVVFDDGVGHSVLVLKDKVYVKKEDVEHMVIPDNMILKRRANLQMSMHRNGNRDGETRY